MLRSLSPPAPTSSRCLPHTLLCGGEHEKYAVVVCDAACLVRLGKRIDILLRPHGATIQGDFSSCGNARADMFNSPRRSSSSESHCSPPPLRPLPLQQEQQQHRLSATHTRPAFTRAFATAVPRSFQAHTTYAITTTQFTAISPIDTGSAAASPSCCCRS